jgi:hypothetical protein
MPCGTFHEASYAESVAENVVVHVEGKAEVDNAGVLVRKSLRNDAYPERGSKNLRLIAYSYGNG